MRDVTLLDTGYLAGLLLFSLVVPLMLSLSAPQHVALRRFCTRTTWLGQVFLGTAGVVILASSAAAPLATLLGALSCAACAVVLHRQIRSASAIEAFRAPGH